jgi:hypothetical protein
MEASGTLVPTDSTIFMRPPMHRRIVPTLQRLRVGHDLARRLDRNSILDACRGAGHS